MVLKSGENRTLSNCTSTSPDKNYHKGVKHLYENGIQHVPTKYILPPTERPNATNKSTTTALNLPIIDFAELNGPDRAQVLKSLSYACENYGFFQVSCFAF